MKIGLWVLIASLVAGSGCSDGTMEISVPKSSVLVVRTGASADAPSTKYTFGPTNGGFTATWEPEGELLTVVMDVSPDKLNIDGTASLGSASTDYFLRPAHWKIRPALPSD